jgi:hypothetical protein
MSRRVSSRWQGKKCFTWKDSARIVADSLHFRIRLTGVQTNLTCSSQRARPIKMVNTWDCSSVGNKPRKINYFFNVSTLRHKQYINCPKRHTTFCRRKTTNIKKVPLAETKRKTIGFPFQKLSRGMSRTWRILKKLIQFLALSKYLFRSTYDFITVHRRKLYILYSRSISIGATSRHIYIKVIWAMLLLTF